MNKKTLVVLACVAGLLANVASQAAENDTRWYVSAMLSGIDADEKRGADDDFGGMQLAFGKHMGNRWSVEAVAVGARFEDGSTQLARQWGFGIDVLGYFLRSEQFQPFVVVGAGYLVTDKKQGLQDEDGRMVSAGLGIKMPAPLGMEFRTDLRARRDYGGPGDLTDYVWNVGVNIPLSGRRVDTRQYGDAAAASAGPSYSFVSDTDGDGFLDPEDRCPNTAGGARVNEYGCAPSDDADGDNVPDGDDMCGDTPAGVAVDKFGCRVTPPAELSVPANGE